MQPRPYPTGISLPHSAWIVSSGFTLPGGPSQDSAQPLDGHTFAMVGGDLLDDTPIDVTFHDLDTAAVPEPASWVIAALTTDGLLGFRTAKRFARRPLSQRICKLWVVAAAASAAELSLPAGSYNPTARRLNWLNASSFGDPSRQSETRSRGGFR